jgi:hypothetical protein
MNPREIRASFIKLFQQTARYRHRYEVFRDFVNMGAYALHNAFHKIEAFENDYLTIIKRYELEDQQRFPQLLALVVDGLEASPHDFLGSVFMELELGNGKAGQFFTPYEVSLMMATMLVGGDEESCLNGRDFLLLNEPAVGAGGMVIAYSEVMKKVGVNPQRKLWALCTDIDPVPAMMCYIQLSLLYIPAVVEIGNSLNPAAAKTYLRTPAHILGFWEGKIKRHFEAKRLLAALEKAEPAAPPQEPEPAPAFISQGGQFELFGKSLSS